MPSNANKASQVVERLQAEIAAHGDLDMVFVAGGVIAIDGRNITVTTEIGAQKLPRPVIAIGVTTDERGRRRGSPGELYQKTVTPDDWNYNRAEAPDDETPLIVWKRKATGGIVQDRGYRKGDLWFVYEGGDRAWQIVPDGVLAWRRP